MLEVDSTSGVARIIHVCIYIYYYIYIIIIIYIWPTLPDAGFV